jgi:3-deoxy-7-phosphoheptulonate synthase
MSLVLIHGLKRPVTRVGRFAGQYAKPRSSPTETGQSTAATARRSSSCPATSATWSTAAEFTPEARTPDPHLMVRGYQHAAMTLNFIRSLLDGGFADIHHPEHWELRFLEHADLTPEQRAQYESISGTLADGCAFMEALGEGRIDGLTASSSTPATRG